jgi:phosphate transport system protein
MSEHTVRAFSEQLESLSTSVAQMGGLAETQFAESIEAIARRDMALAEAAIAGDPRIDQLQQTIEDQAIKVLALRQPMAIDLRDTLAAIKIASELERVGDLAKNIAKRALAYSDRDAAGAEAVWRQDNEIDEIYNSLFRELLTYMMEDPRTISLCTHLLFVAKNIERCGDHATNIAETVYHMVSGGYLATERPKADVTASTTVPFERKI